MDHEAVTAETPPRSARAAPDGFGTGLVGESVALLDSVIDYVFSRLQLEGYRLEVKGKAVIGRVALFLGAVVIGLLGLVFLSVGVATAISDALQSRSSGLLIVGGFYVLAGGAVVAISLARARKT